MFPKFTEIWNYSNTSYRIQPILVWSMSLNLFTIPRHIPEVGLCGRTAILLRWFWTLQNASHISFWIQISRINRLYIYKKAVFLWLRVTLMWDFEPEHLQISNFKKMTKEAKYASYPSWKQTLSSSHNCTVIDANHPRYVYLVFGDLVTF